MNVTLDTLRKKKATKSQIEWFADNFPNGTTRKNLVEKILLNDNELVKFMSFESLEYLYSPKILKIWNIFYELSIAYGVIKNATGYEELYDAKWEVKNHINKLIETLEELEESK